MLINAIQLVLLVSLDTKALQDGINQSAAARRPYLVPAGIHTVGTIRLPNGAHLQFAPGAILRMSPLNADYSPPERLSSEPYADRETSIFEHAMLFATDVDNITIEGPGRIECNRSERGGPKPISIRRSRNIRLNGFTIDQAPNYAISLIDSERVDIGSVTVTRAHADGIDLDGVRNAKIHDCDIESFDDAISLKSSASLQRKLSTSNIGIENCRLKTASMFFKIGTETYGDITKVRVRKLSMTGGMGNRHGNPGIAIMTVDGGNIRDVQIEDVTMDQVGTPIFLRVGERKQAPQSPLAGDMDQIRIRNIKARGTRHASVIAGLEENPIRSLELSDLDLEAVVMSPANPKQVVSETRSAYPEPIQFGPIPASVLFLRNVQGLKLGNLRYLVAPAYPAILMDRVSGKWPGCDPIEPNRWACSDTHPSQRPNSGVRPREMR